MMQRLLAVSTCPCEISLVLCQQSDLLRHNWNWRLAWSLVLSSCVSGANIAFAVPLTSELRKQAQFHVCLPQTVKQRMGAVLPDFWGTDWTDFCLTEVDVFLFVEVGALISLGSRIEFLPWFKDGPFQAIQKGPVFKANALRLGKHCPRNSHGCSSSPSLFLSMD